MKKAIGYARVSTDKQEVSADMQPDKIRKYCLLNDIELVDMVVDVDVSGFTPIYDRPGGSRILQSLGGESEVNCIITLKLDRLFRNTSDALVTTEEWNRKGVALHIVDMGGQSIDTSSAVGRMFLTMMAGFSEMERSLISERTSASLQHRKANRKVYGKIPFGYRVDGNDLVKDPEDIMVVNRILSLKEQGVSLNEIARRCNVGSEKKFYASTIKCIVENSIHYEK